MARMKSKVILLVFLIVIFSVPMAMGYDEAEEEEEERDRGGWRRREEEQESFLLRRSEQIVSTEAGEMRVARGLTGFGNENPVHIGFINMEPKSLFLPQYVDSNLIFFVKRGEVKIGLVYKNSLVEKKLRSGDIYRIEAGYAFYLVNTGSGQRLQLICSIDKNEKNGRNHRRLESTGHGLFQSFLIGGGTHATSVLTGFDDKILQTAFNMSSGELEDILTRRERGPIVYVSDAHQPGKWESFMKLKQGERLGGLMGMEGEDDEDDEEDEEGEKLPQVKKEEQEGSWTSTLMKYLKPETGEQENKDERRKVGSSDSYNLYDRNPDFRNRYGWSLAIDKHQYRPLKRSNIGLYLVNLTAGSMMAPHVNPRATEYGIVLSGEGSLQVVSPKGKPAMNARLQEGDVFVVPRYFPFCQIASRNKPLEFFGFTTSARKNRPQFLAGAHSILQAIRGPELAAAFDMSDKRLSKLIGAQRESVILPTVPSFPPEREEEEEDKRKEPEKEKKHHKELQGQNPNGNGNLPL